MSAALARLTSHGTDRRAAADEFRARHHGGVIGYVGADVPVEYITAAGLLPLRLSGTPGAPSAAGDRFLGTGLDPAARSVLTRLLDGDFGPLDGVVVSRDCEASLRLFYALRELRRVDPALALPPVHLVDVLHLPHRTTTRYVRARLGQLRATVETWAGRSIGDSALADAITVHDRLRELLTRAAVLRRSHPARLTGTQALTVVAATTALPVDRATALLEALLAEAERLPEHEGLRVFLTGSPHDTDHVYTALEDSGLLVVGEDHDWGDLLSLRRTAAPTEAALAERYQYNGPAAPRASIRARAAHTRRAARECGAQALVSYARIRDDAPGWDYPAQREATGLPSVRLSRQPYGALGDEAAEALAALAGPVRAPAEPAR
ncbi:2-hydroxyacyl-CoA dehydratase family protein [Streptomyces olivaceus]|uniref:2-hydroxyacyl-CoA dehydratase family protein n=1 Tax=Streptomyces TaxID=1883 RepID=UPI001CCEABCE|nr:MULTISPECIES: 2-hydroxyacyl-CoA dehydratase family protein [Streptomyces]MBZ6259650.1 2-hydroxyacyl-CoA dehydratase family protein [Streptomyces olivaceus]MCM8550150.1 2-hydroxyacyl-CoA dehydratase family protein [Streptomyces sp. STCH 565 A]